MMYENVVVQLLLDVFFFISIGNLNFFLRMNKKLKNSQRSVSLKIIFIDVHASVHGGQKRVLDSLELELQAIVIHEM